MLVPVAVALMLLQDAGSPGCVTADVAVITKEDAGATDDNRVAPDRTTLCVKWDEKGVSFSFRAKVNGRMTQYYSPPLNDPEISSTEDYRFVGMDEKCIQWELGLHAGAVNACVADGPISSRVCAIIPRAPHDLVQWMEPRAHASRPEPRPPTAPPDGGPALSTPDEGTRRPKWLTLPKFEVPWNIQPRTGLVTVKCIITEKGVATDCVVLQPINDAVDREVLHWVSQQRWTPATVKCKPVPITQVFHFQFSTTRERR